MLCSCGCSCLLKATCLIQSLEVTLTVRYTLRSNPGHIKIHYINKEKLPRALTFNSSTQIFLHSAAPSGLLIYAYVFHGCLHPAYCVPLCSICPTEIHYQSRQPEMGWVSFQMSLMCEDVMWVGSGHNLNARSVSHSLDKIANWEMSGIEKTSLNLASEAQLWKQFSNYFCWFLSLSSRDGYVPNQSFCLFFNK